MASPAEIIRQVLLDAGLVTLPPETEVPGDNTVVCYVGSMPDENDLAVCVYDTAGLLGPKLARSKHQMVHPGIKILVRGPDYTYYGLANSVALALDDFITGTVTVQGDTSHQVQSIYRTSGVISMGEEVGKKRQVWSVNARVAFQNSEPSLG